MNEQTKHTTGPWHRNIRAKGHYPTIYAGRNTHVAHAAQMSTPEETEANIDLISAAPDLLAALDGLFEHCAMVHKYWGEGCNQKEADAAIAFAKAAIQKAGGQLCPQQPSI